MSSPVETKRIRDHLQIQEGGGGTTAPLLVNLEDDGTFVTFDVSFKDVRDAVDAGQMVLVVWDGDTYIQKQPVTGLQYLKSGEGDVSSSAYVVEVGANTHYTVGSIDGYPTYQYN